MTTLKLFIWDDVLKDWSSGMMFAIAENVEEARALLKKECNYIPDKDLLKEPEIHELNEKITYLIWGGG